MKKLIVVLGPTAVGKSTFAIQLAQHFNTEIISADSRQFFQELRIGVARPSDDDLKCVPHHFISFMSIKDHYSAGTFERDALDRIQSLFNKSDYVVCVGGSGLYLQAIVQGLDDLPTDTSIRKKLIEKLHNTGIASLLEELKIQDKEYFDEVDQTNPHRIIRAMEICLITGKKYSGLRSATSKLRPFEIVKIGLNCERDLLYSKINQRVDEMMLQGLENEARQVYSYRNLNALNTVGYKELFEYFDGKLTIAEALSKIKQHTRNFAKRQVTWWRRETDIHWFDITSDSILENSIQAIKN